MLKDEHGCGWRISTQSYLGRLGASKLQENPCLERDHAGTTAFLLDPDWTLGFTNWMLNVGQLELWVQIYPQYGRAEVRRHSHPLPPRRVPR